MDPSAEDWHGNVNPLYRGRSGAPAGHWALALVDILSSEDVLTTPLFPNCSRPVSSLFQSVRRSAR
jgi:hypothetical protein